METQNVSAQLYEKQLPDDPLIYNCKTDPTNSYLETCVDPAVSGAKIENAFQEQLNLSEYYKSPYVFETMKKTYYDETMEAEVNNDPIVEVAVTPMKYANADAVLEPVGPRDFLQKKLLGAKESFGSSSGGSFFLWMVLIVLIIFFAFIYYNYFRVK